MPIHGHFSITFVDQASQSSVQRLTSAVLTAGNIVAQTAAQGALVSATQAMSAGNLTRTLLGNQDTLAPGPATAPAFRSDKFAVTYNDATTGDTYTTQIPVAANAGITYEPDSKLLDLAATPTSTYVTAFEAFVLSEDLNAVTISKIRRVGRHI